MTKVEIPTNLKPVTPEQIAFAAECGREIAIQLGLAASAAESVHTHPDAPGIVALLFRRGIVLHLWVDTMGDGSPFLLCCRHRRWQHDGTKWVKVAENMYDAAETYALLGEARKSWEDILS